MNTVINKIAKRIVYTVKKTKFALIGCIIFLLVFTDGDTVSGSMEPTIMTGDFTYGLNALFWYTPQRGDIITFEHNGQLWEKRIIGLPGEMIVIKDNTVYIDGNPLEENYIPEGTNTYSGVHSIYYVPEGKIMVLGDNREDSNDSRYWEDPYVNISDIRSKYLITIVNLPWHRGNAVQRQESVLEPEIMEPDIIEIGE